MKTPTFGTIKTYKYEFFDRNGKECLDKDAIAHSITSDETGITRYYIRAHGRILYDVQSVESSYHKKYPWKDVMVPKKKYDQYVKYLKTKRTRFLTLAMRS